MITYFSTLFDPCNVSKKVIVGTDASAATVCFSLRFAMLPSPKKEEGKEDFVFFYPSSLKTLPFPPKGYISNTKPTLLYALYQGSGHVGDFLVRSQATNTDAEAYTLEVWMKPSTVLRSHAGATVTADTAPRKFKRSINM